jgi:hypothetical protein
MSELREHRQINDSSAFFEFNGMRRLLATKPIRRNCGAFSL